MVDHAVLILDGGSRATDAGVAADFDALLGRDVLDVQVSGAPPTMHPFVGGHGAESLDQVVEAHVARSQLSAKHNRRLRCGGRHSIDYSIVGGNRRGTRDGLRTVDENNVLVAVTGVIPWSLRPRV